MSSRTSRWIRRRTSGSRRLPRDRGEPHRRFGVGYGRCARQNPPLATNYRESGLVVCPACSIAWGWKSPIQPDGGEGLAKHKGGTARWRLKAVQSKTATGRTEIGYQATLVGRAGHQSRSPESINGQSCRSGRCAGKAIELTWGGLRHVPISELRTPRGALTVAQESADGIVGQNVGKASEALQGRKTEQRIGRAGNDGRRPERLGVASRTGNS